MTEEQIKKLAIRIDEVARPLFDALVEIMKECDDNHSVVAKARAYSIARHAILKATEQHGTMLFK